MNIALILSIAVMLACAAAAFYFGFRFNRVRCETCGDTLRERDSIEHGGDPCAYTHYGICADRHAKIHAQMHYGGDTQ